MDYRIYLDGHASTPLAPEAQEAMMKAFLQPGNAYSQHFAGIEAARTIDDARTAIAELIGCVGTDLTFTSGATEANNLAILGCARSALRTGSPRRELLVSAIEHKSVLAAADALVLEGFTFRMIPVDRCGRVEVSVLEANISDKTLLVSISGANGEIGSVQNLEPIIMVARRMGALVHSDIAQIAGKLPINVVNLDVDYASISAHKMYGPQGIGALYISPFAPRLVPLSFGGGQERGLRPGTTPAALAAGFGAAARLVSQNMAASDHRVARISRRFLDELSRLQVHWKINGDARERIPGSLSIQLKGSDSDSIINRVSKNLAISTGSACQSGEIQPSHVLSAIGLDEDEIRSTVRILFTPYNKDEDPDIAADIIAKAVHQEQLATGSAVQ